MNTWLVALIACAAGASPHDGLSIRGIVVNASLGDAPVPDTPVVLRAEHQGTMMIVAESRTDNFGEFQFTGLPATDKFVFLPGANYRDIHYPGTRIRPSDCGQADHQTIRVYEPIEEPNPLRAAQHQISIRAEAGVLVVTETLIIANRTLRTYVGKAQADQTHAPTLGLSIPAEFAKVTFDKEFFGRQFKVVTGRLETQIPWTPGDRELRFTYRLPFESRYFEFRRRLDLRTDQLRIEVARSEVGDVSSALPVVVDPNSGAAVFEARTCARISLSKCRLANCPCPGQTLPAGARSPH
jgi:hypothetical protein